MLWKIAEYLADTCTFWAAVCFNSKFVKVERDPSAAPLCHICQRPMIKWGTTKGDGKKRWICTNLSIHKKPITFSGDQGFWAGRKYDPYFIVRILQLRYERCSTERISSILNLYPKAVRKYIAGYLNNSSDISLKNTRKEIKDLTDRNYIKDRLVALSSKKSLLINSTNHFDPDKHCYEIMFEDKYRIYHLIRTENNFQRDDLVAFKCRQLFCEGFDVKDLLKIFGCAERYIRYYLEMRVNKGMDQYDIDNRQRILEYRLKSPKGYSKSSFIECVYVKDALVKPVKDIGVQWGSPYGFYLNIKAEDGIAKSIKSIYPGNGTQSFSFQKDKNFSG